MNNDLRKPINELNLDYRNSNSYEDRNRYAALKIGEAAQHIRSSPYYDKHTLDLSLYEQVDGLVRQLSTERRMELADGVVPENVMREVHEKNLLVLAYTGGPYSIDNTDASRITSRDDYNLVHTFWRDWWLPEHRSDYMIQAA